MSLEELQVVHTCGVCVTICDEYDDHPCLEGYEYVHLNENYYFYPLLDDQETLIRRAVLPDGSEGLIEDSIFLNKENSSPNSFKSPQPPKKKTKVSKSVPPVRTGKKLRDEEVEQLIIEVQQRVPLWNINIPLKDRTRETVARLWEEVATAMKGRLTAMEAKTKFKSLRDTYRKIVQAEHRSSGSGRVDSQDHWKFYECCEFLRDSCLIRPTTTNVTRETEITNSDRAENIDDLDSSIDADESTNDTFDDTNVQSSGHTVNKTRRCSSKDNAIDSVSALNRIAEVLCRESSPVALPEPPKMYTIGAYLTGMGNQIRLLPQPVQMDIIKQFTDTIYNASRQYSSQL